MTAAGIPQNLLSRAPELVAIGASAGGFDALLFLLEGQREDSRLGIVAVLHLPATHEGSLADVFRSRTGMRVVEAQAHAPVEPGCVHFAPAGYHLLVENDRTFSLSCDPPVMFSRPSIDVLFESAADACGERLAGFVLTGANIDGAAGLAAVKARGGLAVVQDPARAAHATMPAAALAAARPHAVLPIAGLNRLLTRLLHP